MTLGVGVPFVAIVAATVFVVCTLWGRATARRYGERHGRLRAALADRDREIEGLNAHITRLRRQIGEEQEHHQQVEARLGQEAERLRASLTTGLEPPPLRRTESSSRSSGDDRLPYERAAVRSGPPPGFGAWSPSAVAQVKPSPASPERTVYSRSGLSDVGPGDQVVLVEVRFYRPSRSSADLDGSFPIVRRSIMSEVPEGHRPTVDFLADYAASTLSDPTWPALTDQWVADVDPLDAEAAGVTIGDLQRSMHELLLVKPVETGADVLRLRPVVGDITADLAGTITLPMDRMRRKYAEAARVIGVVAGAATGRPALTLACFRPISAKAFGRLVEGVVIDAADHVPPDTPSVRPTVARPGREFPTAPAVRDVDAVLPSERGKVAGSFPEDALTSAGSARKAVERQPQVDDEWFPRSPTLLPDPPSHATPPPSADRGTGWSGGSE